MSDPQPTSLFSVGLFGAPKPYPTQSSDPAPASRLSAESGDSRYSFGVYPALPSYRAESFAASTASSQLVDEVLTPLFGATKITTPRARSPGFEDQGGALGAVAPWKTRRQMIATDPARMEGDEKMDEWQIAHTELREKQWATQVAVNELELAISRLEQARAEEKTAHAAEDEKLQVYLDARRKYKAKLDL